MFTIYSLVEHIFSYVLIPITSPKLPPLRILGHFLGIPSTAYLASKVPHFCRFIDGIQLLARTTIPSITWNPENVDLGSSNPDFRNRGPILVISLRKVASPEIYIPFDSARREESNGTKLIVIALTGEKLFNFKGRVLIHT